MELHNPVTKIKFFMNSNGIGNHESHVFSGTGKKDGNGCDGGCKGLSVPSQFQLVVFCLDLPHLDVLWVECQLGNVFPAQC